MHSIIDDLLAASPDGQKEMARAKLRVDVSEQLLLHMQTMGMTKAALAEALGVSRSAVSQALTGNRNMSLNTLADMSRALKLQVRVLVERPNQVSAQARSSTHTTPVLTWSISRPQEPAAVRTEASSGAGLTGAYTITPVGHYAPASAELQ